MNKFNQLISKILNEGEVVQNANSTIVETPFDIAKSIVTRMIEDPRDLLPPVDMEKFIEQDKKEKNGVKFTWRYGNDVYVDIKVTPNNIFIYDVRADKIIFSTPTTETPVHDVQNLVFSEIEKIVQQDKEEDEAGVTQPMDIGTQNTSKLPGAEKPISPETVTNYFKNTNLKNR
jgi:hypothetical protein